jgi:hypothetical protein
MPLRAVLLRLFLAFALVLNGIGSAAAGVRMAAADAAPVAAEHCHESAPAAAKSPQPHRGCCESGLCGCDCVAAAMFATGVPFVPAARPEARAVHRIATGHRAPVRAPTLRPPIGQAA